MIYNEISCFSILNLLSYGFKLKGDEVSLPDNTQFEMSESIHLWIIKQLLLFLRSIWWILAAKKYNIFLAKGEVNIVFQERLNHYTDLKNSNSCIILTSADITFTICYSNACTHKQGYMAILTCHTGKTEVPVALSIFVIQYLSIA